MLENHYHHQLKSTYSAVKPLIASKISFYLHNVCVNTVYMYYVYTHTQYKLGKYVHVYISIHIINIYIYIYILIYIYIYIYISGGPLSALTCCVNVRLLSAIKKYRR